jgi:anti-sigma factor RsiW
MKCQDVQHLIHPYSDSELDVVRHVEIEVHLTECAMCAELEKNMRLLRAASASPSLYYKAPAGLRTRIQAATRRVKPGRDRSSLRLAAIAASVLLLIGASAIIGMRWLPARPSADDRLAERVIAGHARSLQVDHLIDVESSDKHVVKPWFRGKLDFSPQVPDLSPQGYPLFGGRLDYLADRPVAALVYFRAKHAINLFTWPAANDEEKAVQRLARQGFHVRHWQRSGLTYWAISDLNDQELDEFVGLFQEHSAE